MLLNVPSAGWWTAQPRIVAESLEAVPDPLQTALHPGEQAPGSAVACALARSLAPEEAKDAVPRWLLPGQAQSFRRLLAALRRHRGAVLADPVGTGKTYIALAAAAALNTGSTACLVPAVLLQQWERTAAQLGIPVLLSSHEQASRGRLPQGSRGLVIIDESHHFRNPRTRRYRHVSEWLVGRSALMVTATPVVNRPADLSNQLLLSVRDDALLLDGILSLRALLSRGCTNTALGQLVIEADANSQVRPGAVQQVSTPDQRENVALDFLIERLHRLRLSNSPAIAALVRGILLRAAASSPAALTSALTRYRGLLLHAQDAFRSGGLMNRSELRRFTAELSDQLLWWELISSGGSGCDLDLSDLDQLDDLMRRAAAGESRDDKLARLASILSDGIPSVVFAGFRETVRYLRVHLGNYRLAWCTGDRAGIGRMPLDRSAVFGWFRETTTSSLAPQHLIVTDLAAEGLDLQRAGRIVHYDLPWTPMRVQQREGRSLRYGSGYPEVQVVRFSLPKAVERMLGIESILTQKSRLPGAVGLGPGGSHVWRWRGDLADRFSEGAGIMGAARVVSPREGLLAGFELHGGPYRQRWISRTVLWLEANGSWTEAPEVLGQALDAAAKQPEVLPIEVTCLKRWLGILSRQIRDRVSQAGSRRWIAANPTPPARAVAARLQALTGVAARMRQPTHLARLENALNFVVRGHTAGEARIIDRMAESSDRDFERRVYRLASEPEWAPIDARLIGLIVFGPGCVAAMRTGTTAD